MDLLEGDENRSRLYGKMREERKKTSHW